MPLPPPPSSSYSSPLVYVSLEKEKGRESGIERYNGERKDGDEEDREQGQQAGDVLEETKRSVQEGQGAHRALRCQGFYHNVLYHWKAPWVYQPFHHVRTHFSFSETPDFLLIELASFSLFLYQLFLLFFWFKILDLEQSNSSMSTKRSQGTIFGALIMRSSLSLSLSLYVYILNAKIVSLLRSYRVFVIAKFKVFFFFLKNFFMSSRVVTLTFFSYSINGDFLLLFIYYLYYKNWVNWTVDWHPFVKKGVSLKGCRFPLTGPRMSILYKASLKLVFLLTLSHGKNILKIHNKKFIECV